MHAAVGLAEARAEAVDVALGAAQPDVQPAGARGHPGRGEPALSWRMSWRINMLHS
jgi:hypothetical protein